MSAQVAVVSILNGLNLRIFILSGSLKIKDFFQFTYRKVPKFWEARNLCCNLPKIQTNWPNLKGICQNGANGIANVKTLITAPPLGAV